MEMQDIIAQREATIAKIAILEREANQLDEQARSKRSERMALKTTLQELDVNIAKAVDRQTAAKSASAAEQAQKAAEASKTEAAAAADRIKQKEKEADSLIAELKATLAKLQAAPTEETTGVDIAP